MKKIIETDSLLDIASDIINNVEFLDMLDEDEGGDIEYYTPAIRQAVEELQELVDKALAAEGGIS